MWRIRKAFVDRVVAAVHPYGAKSRNRSYPLSTLSL